MYVGLSMQPSTPQRVLSPQRGQMARLGSLPLGMKAQKVLGAPLFAPFATGSGARPRTGNGPHVAPDCV